jgi:O-antigen ligase
MRTDWARATGATLLFGGLAIAIGGLIPVLPAPAQLALVLAVTLPVITLMTRSWVRLGGSRREGSAARDDEGPAVETSDYWLARWLTYVGFGTLALLTLRPTPALTLSDWVFLGALVVALTGYLTKARAIHIAPPRLMLAGATLVLIGAVLSLPNATAETESLAVVARFIYLTVGWFALAGYALRTSRDISIATQIWVASVALSGAAAVAQLLGGGLIPGTVAASGRMVGFAQHVTDLGGMCAIALIPAVSFLDARGRSPVRSIASAALVAFVAGGLLLSGSVDGFVAAAVGLAVWIWTGSAGRRGIGALLGLAALFVIIAGATAQLGLVLPGARIASVLSSPDDPSATFYLRLQTFSLAWQSIGTSPVFGVGFDTTSATNSAVGLIHNVLIATWFQGGVFALIGIVLVLLSAAKTAWRAWARSESREDQRLAAALLAAVASAITFSMGNPILFQRYVWAPVFLAIALVAHRAPTRASARKHETAFAGRVDRATTSARSSS